MVFQEFLSKFGLLVFCPVGASCSLVIHSLEISVLKREIWQFLWQLLNVSRKSPPHVSLLFYTYFHAGICIFVIPQGKLVQFFHGLLETAAGVELSATSILPDLEGTFCVPTLSSAAFLCHWQPSHCLSCLEFREFPVTSVTAVFGSLLPLFNSFCQLSYHCWLQKFICCRQQKVHIWSAWRCCPGCCPRLLFVCVSSCSVAS